MNCQSKDNAIINLNSIRVDVSGRNNEELIQIGQEIYLRECVAEAVAGRVITHDGIRVYIYPKQFDHAFYDARTRSRRGIWKDRIDSSRVERIRWIIPIVAGQVDNTECWVITDYSAYKKPPPFQRLYVYKPEPYVIWLKSRKDGTFYFKSAYKASWADYRGYVERQRRIR